MKNFPTLSEVFSLAAGFIDRATEVVEHASITKLFIMYSGLDNS